jgi:nucleoside-diphosphate-sugar epimerase
MFEVVGVADLDHDDLTDVFRGLCCTLCIQTHLIPNSLFMIDVDSVVLLSNLPLVKGQVTKAANLVVQSGSSGTRHVLEYARAANVARVILTGSFANVLHPDNSWSPIVVTEDGG